MKFSFLLLAIIITRCFSNISFGQNTEWEWVKIVNCESLNMRSPLIGVDLKSNLYITDNYSCIANACDTNISLSSNRMFFAKNNSLGNNIWLKEYYTFNGINNIGSFDISNNSMYIIGVYSDSIFFGDTTLISSSDNDLFITKYDTAGNFNWAFAEEVNGNLFYPKITSNDNSEVIISGTFSGNVNVGDTTFTAYDNCDFFISKYSSTNQNEWNIHGFGTGYISTTAITYDNLGFIYVTGRFAEHLTVNGYSLTNSYTSSFVMKINQFGEVQWLKKIEGISLSIVIDNENNIFLGVSSDSKYLIKIDSDGNLLWENGNGRFNCKSLAIDSNNLLIAFGTLSGKVIIDNIEYFTDSIWAGYENGWHHDADIFAVITDLSGNVLQVTQVKDYHNEGIYAPQYGTNVVSNNHNVFTSGAFKGSGIFNGVDTLSGNGFYIGKLNINQLRVVNKIDNTSIVIYPNPSSEYLNIKTPQKENNYIITILDSKGRVIRKVKKHDGIINLNISDLETGIYFIVIENTKNKFVKRIIKL